MLDTGGGSRSSICSGILDQIVLGFFGLFPILLGIVANVLYSSYVVWGRSFNSTFWPGLVCKKACRVHCIIGSFCMFTQGFFQLLATIMTGQLLCYEASKTNQFPLLKYAKIFTLVSSFMEYIQWVMCIPGSL